MGDTSTNQEKREVKMIFKKKLLDDQYKINSEKIHICKMLECDFKEEYRSVLTKMLRFCNNIEKDNDQKGHLEVDKDILDLDIIPFYAARGLNFQNMAVSPMNEEAEKSFANLFS